MPKIRFELASQRSKGLDEYVQTYILRSERAGTIRDARHVLPTSKAFTVDAAPGDYLLQLEVAGFSEYYKKLTVPSSDAPGVTPVSIVLQHKCKTLPGFGDLRPEQVRLLKSFDPQTSASDLWRDLSDNKCTSFFQITWGLAHTPLANGRLLSDYVESIRQIGGSRIADTIPDGKSRTAVGWRLHAVIKGQDRDSIESDLAEGEFAHRESFVHPTHKKFGFRRNYRENGGLPNFQIVLNDERSMADIDFDVEFHRSSPADVYEHFRTRFPGTEGIYEF